MVGTLSTNVVSGTFSGTIIVEVALPLESYQEMTGNSILPLDSQSDRAEYWETCLGISDAPPEAPTRTDQVKH